MGELFCSLGKMNSCICMLGEERGGTENSVGQNSARAFFFPSDGRRVTKVLPVSKGPICCGSCKDWVFWHLRHVVS